MPKAARRASGAMDATRKGPYPPIRPGDKLPISSKTQPTIKKSPHVAKQPVSVEDLAATVREAAFKEMSEDQFAQMKPGKKEVTEEKPFAASKATKKRPAIESPTAAREPATKKSTAKMSAPVGVSSDTSSICTSYHQIFCD